MEEEVGDTLEGSSFYSALKESQETLLMLDRTGEVMFRPWCLYEWHQTRMKKYPPSRREKNSLCIATGMGLVGSALVSSGLYIEMIKRTGDNDGIRSHKAVASDPRD